MTKPKQRKGEMNIKIKISIIDHNDNLLENYKEISMREVVQAKEPADIIGHQMNIMCDEIIKRIKGGL